MSILFNGACYHQYPATGLPLAQAAKTVCMWLNLNNSAALQTFINAVDPTLSIGYQVGVNASNMTVWSFGGAALIQTPAPTLNTWVHLAYRFDGTTHAFLWSGVPASTSTTTPQSGQPTLCQVGGNQWSEYPRLAQVEDLRVYNRALTDNELVSISSLQTQDMIVSGLVAWWTMSEYVSGTVLDNVSEQLKESYGLTSILVGNVPYPVAQDSPRFQRRMK